MLHCEDELALVDGLDSEAPLGTLLAVSNGATGCALNAAASLASSRTHTACTVQGPDLAPQRPGLHSAGVRSTCNVC